LAGHVWGPVIAGILLWSIIEGVICEVLYSQSGHGWLTVALKIVLSATIGIPLFYFMIKKYGTVTFDDEKPTKVLGK